MGYESELFQSPEELEKVRIEKYRGYLIEHDYRVEDPPTEYRFLIHSSDELLDFFYARMSLKHPNLKITRQNRIIDRKIMKSFIEYRIKARGINKKRAMSECAEMIDLLFKNEDKFNFRYPISSVGILGQKKFKWVTEKLEDFLLQEELIQRENNRRAFNRALGKRYDFEMREENINKEEELMKILKEMEELDGEGKNRS